MIIAVSFLWTPLQLLRLGIPSFEGVSTCQSLYQPPSLSLWYITIALGLAFTTLRHPKAFPLLEEHHLSHHLLSASQGCTSHSTSETQLLSFEPSVKVLIKA